jgi:hypothetical protein
MKRILIMSALLLGGCTAVEMDHVQTGKQASLLLAEDGVSRYRIVVPEDASLSVTRGAEELQLFLKQMTGAELPIVKDSEPVSEYEILLGDNTHLEAHGIEVDFTGLETEGYTLKTEGNQLVIAGSDIRGTMYGVYGLLEEHLGCRWFTPDCSRIPAYERLVIQPLDETKHPSFEYRSNFVKDCWDGAWTSRNRLNGDSQSGHLTHKYGWGVKYGPGGRGHSSLHLVPPGKYYNEHPDYYVLRNGERVTREICFSSEGALQAAIEKMREDMLDNPDKRIFSVSQMDGNDWACHCEKCRALSEKEGTAMAPVLTFVNKVAKAVEDEFPSNAVITFAYRWTRVPPKTIKPRDNVIIFLCNIECCFMHPLDTCDCQANKDFSEQIKTWAEISDRLWVWNYETDFHHYLVPFPNYHTWAPNYRFLHANHVTGLFTQDDFQNVNAELSAFGGYVRAKLLWDVNYDAETAMNEFLENYYGPAAPYIREYINMLVNKVTNENIHAEIYVMYPWPYLTEDILAKSDELWENAEQAVQDNPVRLKRVKYGRLSPDYAIIEHERRSAKIDRNAVDHAHFMYKTDNERLNERIVNFLELAPVAGIVTLQEGYYDLNDRMKDFVLTPQRPVEADGTVPGLDCWIAKGAWKRAVDFQQAVNVQREITDNLTIRADKLPAECGISLKGYIDVPRNGFYRFFLNADCPAALYIGDNAHRPHRGDVLAASSTGKGVEQEGLRPLKKGLHSFHLSFTKKGDSEIPVVSWEGPDMSKQKIPGSALFRKEPTGTEPRLILPETEQAELTGYFRFEDGDTRNKRPATEATGSIQTAVYRGRCGAQAVWDHLLVYGNAINFRRGCVLLGPGGDEVMNTLGPEFTITCWIRPDRTSRDEFSILGAPGCNPWAFSMKEGALIVKTPEKEYTVSAEQTGIQRDRWTHIGVNVRSGRREGISRIRFYVNGRQVGEELKGSGTTPTAAKGWMIGQRAEPLPAFRGRAGMDELRIYKGTVTPGEKAALIPADNLAKGKPATSSDKPDLRFPPGNANNGILELNNYWNGGPYPDWWMVDLEDVRTIDRIHVFTYWADKRYYQYTIEVSPDGESWETVVDMSENTALSTSKGYTHTFEPVEARYIRVNMLKNSANPGVHINEIFIFSGTNDTK